MKTATIIAFILLQGIIPRSYAHVYLDYPYGGETFMANTIINIEWHIAIPHEQLNWDLFFSVDGGETWQPIQYDLPVSQLSYSWVVPSIATSQARISIIQDNVDMDYQDESIDFTIEPEPNTPFIDVTAQNLNLSCDANNQEGAINQWLDDHGGAVAVGFCGELVWTHDYYELTNECGYTGNAYVTFSAADECGSASTSAYLNVSDFEAPLIEVSATNSTVECDENQNMQQLDNWLNYNGGAVATDACGNVQWNNNFPGLDVGCGLTGSVVVIFIATDECGNSSTTSASFSIEDNTPPVITHQAEDKIISCADTTLNEQLQQWLQNNAGATALDACGSVAWTNNYSTLNADCGTTGSTPVTFTAMDDCGNINTTTADLIIRDDIPPTLKSPARDTLIDCTLPNAKSILNQWLNTHGGAVASDECGDVSWTHDFPTLPDTCDITRNLAVTFTASDDCGNTSSTAANITLLVTTSTGENLDQRFSIIPNPAKDHIQVQLELSQDLPVQVVLLDAVGRVHLTRILDQHEFILLLKDFAPGIYVIKIHLQEKVLVRQFSIQ